MGVDVCMYVRTYVSMNVCVIPAWSRSAKDDHVQVVIFSLPINKNNSALILFNHYFYIININ